MDELNRLPTDNDIINRTCNHQCSCCGSCCGEFIPLTIKEYYAIKSYMEKHPEIKGHYLIKDRGPDDHAVKVFCPFLNPDTHKCDIYSVRPYACRHFKCDKSKETIAKERYEYAVRADYNSFEKNPKEKGTASWHFLFFEDYLFDIYYRDLLFKQFGKQLPLAKQAEVMPMLVDNYVKY